MRPPIVVVAALFVGAAMLVRPGAERVLAQTAGDGFPKRFASRADALQASCRVAAVKGPSTETCVLTAFRDRTLHVVVFERAGDGAYSVSNHLVLPSWYETATLSFADLGTGIDWLVVQTEGMRGTGLTQRLLLMIGWDGQRFRTAAAESLDYRCFKPSAPSDYALHVRHTFERAGGAPVLRLDYELTRDDRPIGRWSDQLRWNASQFAFAPYKSTADVTEPVVVRTRNQIGRARVYSAVSPLNPAGDASKWIGDSELMDVLGPACAPSVAGITREFVGKWGLDEKRTAAASPGGVTADVALVVGWDRRALSISRKSGARETYRFDGAATTVAVGQASGKATAVLDGDRMLVTIVVDGRSRPLRRLYYLAGHTLVVEESGANSPKSTAYYDKF